MRTLRIAIGCLLLVMLAAPLVSCVVHTEGRATYRTTSVRQHTWYYYPHYDVYYSPTASTWVYWSGTHWVTVDRRPRWITIAPTSYSVTISYYGTRPWRYWDHHRQHYWRPHSAQPRYVPRSEPRHWRGPVDERGLQPTAPRQRPTQPQPRPRPGPVDERGFRSQGTSNRGTSSSSSSSSRTFTERDSRGTTEQQGFTGSSRQSERDRQAQPTNRNQRTVQPQTPTHTRRESANDRPQREANPRPVQPQRRLDEGGQRPSNMSGAGARNAQPAPAPPRAQPQPAPQPRRTDPAPQPRRTEPAQQPSRADERQRR